MLSTAATHAATDERLDWFADFRARIEQDWGSRDADGMRRENRLRLRARARVGARFHLRERWEFGLRLRSGADESQQSPHVTLLDFDDNATGPADFNLDRWYARVRFGDERGWIWLGRNDLPFWKRNELVWDDDVTLMGLGAGGRIFEAEGHSLKWNGGYFTLPEGMRSSFGMLATAQAVYAYRADSWKLTAALGGLEIAADPPGSGGLLLQGNDTRDYRIVVGSLEWERTVGGQPLGLGLDLIDNRKGYAARAGETSGFAGSIQWGSVREKGDQAFRLEFAEIEALAVNNSFAQDDWVRWGSGGQTRGSDLRGWELRYSRALGPGMKLTARLFLVRSISTAEDGKRLRVDFNLSFPRN